MSLRPEDALAIVHAAGKTGSFSLHLAAVQRLPAVRAVPRDVGRALETVETCWRARDDLLLLKRLRRIPMLRGLSPEAFWVALGQDLRARPLTVLVQLSPYLRVFYLWR